MAASRSERYHDNNWLHVPVNYHHNQYHIVIIILSKSSSSMCHYNKCIDPPWPQAARRGPGHFTLHCYSYYAYYYYYYYY